ncbi:hypothetical protein F4824DRAFT_48498 [Ustulina deusta]|nr:hypothetical protein F4824DRAFT_48498 [Ustulina deusta]
MRSMMSLIALYITVADISVSFRFLFASPLLQHYTLLLGSTHRAYPKWTHRPMDPRSDKPCTLRLSVACLVAA